MSTLRDDERDALVEVCDCWESGKGPHPIDFVEALIEARVAAALTKQAEDIATAIEDVESFAHGNNETSKAHLIGFGTMRRRAARIAREFGQQKEAE